MRKKYCGRSHTQKNENSTSFPVAVFTFFYREYGSSRRNLSAQLLCMKEGMLKKMEIQPYNMNIPRNQLTNTFLNIISCMHKYECVPFGMEKYLPRAEANKKQQQQKSQKINNKEENCHR
jgi:hypothetical protein